jgi:hypothetical protein
MGFELVCRTYGRPLAATTVPIPPKGDSAPTYIGLPWQGEGMGECDRDMQRTDFSALGSHFQLVGSIYPRLLPQLMRMFE